MTDFDWYLVTNTARKSTSGLILCRATNLKVALRSLADYYDMSRNGTLTKVDLVHVPTGNITEFEGNIHEFSKRNS